MNLEQITDYYKNQTTCIREVKEIFPKSRQSSVIGVASFPTLERQFH